MFVTAVCVLLSLDFISTLQCMISLPIVVHLYILQIQPMSISWRRNLKFQAYSLPLNRQKFLLFLRFIRFVYYILYSTCPACHAGDRALIPRRGDRCLKVFFPFFLSILFFSLTWFTVRKQLWCPSKYEKKKRIVLIYAWASILLENIDFRVKHGKSRACVTDQIESSKFA